MHFKYPLNAFSNEKDGFALSRDTNIFVVVDLGEGSC